MNAPAPRVVLYNPRAVFFTMPLALLAIGSELDPSKYEVVIVDGRLDPHPEQTVAALLPGALCLGVTVLAEQSKGDEIRDLSSHSDVVSPDI